jgi:hypothetical protein
MATRTVTITPTDGGHGAKAVWTGLLNGDDGTPLDWFHFADRCVQVLGTFGTGGSIRLEWSNDGGTTWVTCTDPQGNDIIKTAAGGEAVTEVGLLVRPRVTAGDGTTSLQAILAMRAPR